MAATSTSTSTTSIKYSNPVTARDRELRGAEDLAARYGNIDYDRGAIENVFQGAVDKEYAAKQQAYDRSANQYYDRLSQSQDSYLDAMRKQAAMNSVQSGATQGMNAANQLSAMLGMSQQTSGDATALAQEQRALADQQAAAQAAATRQALEYANAQKLALGTLGSNIYATDAQKYIGELGANAQLEAANTAASAQGYAADQGLAGTQYNADQNLAGQRYAADQNLRGVDLTSGRNLEGQRYASDQQLAGTQYNADMNYKGNVYTADQNLAGTRYTSDNNLAGTRYAADQNLAGQQAVASATTSAAASQASAARYAAQQNVLANKYAADAATKQTWNTTVASTIGAAANNNLSVEQTLSQLYDFSEAPDDSRIVAAGRANQG